MGKKNWLMLIALSIIWGGSYFFTKYALQAFSPVFIVFVRVTLGALVLLPFTLKTGKQYLLDRKNWPYFLILGALNNVIPFSLIAWSQTRISGSLASIINATTPFFTALIAHYVTSDEKLTTSKVFGIALGFFGVVVLIGFNVLKTISMTNLGELAALIAAVSYACAGIFGRRFKGMPSVAVANAQLIASAIIAAPLIAFERGALIIADPGWMSLLAISVMAILSTGVAYILYFRILSSSGATNVLLVTLLVPVSAIILNTTISGEVLPLKAFLGMVFIALGLLMIDRRILGLVRK